MDWEKPHSAYCEHSSPLRALRQNKGIKSFWYKDYDVLRNRNKMGHLPGAINRVSIQFLNVYHPYELPANIVLRTVFKLSQIGWR